MAGCTSSPISVCGRHTSPFRPCSATSPCAARDFPFRKIFLLFGAFILACGTHSPDGSLAVLVACLPARRRHQAVYRHRLLGDGRRLGPGRAQGAGDAQPRSTGTGNHRSQADRRMPCRPANTALEHQLEALRASEERFRLLVDSTEDYAIFMLDPTGQVSSWNHGAERIKQYAAEEIIGQHFSRFYPPKISRVRSPNESSVAAATEGRHEDEGWRLRKDGSRFWANVVITALRGDGGKLRGFSKVTRDMTERKEAEEKAGRLLQEEAARRATEQYAHAIAEQREQLRVTLASIGDGVVATDAMGRVTMLNPVAAALTGWTQEEAVGKPLTNVFQIINEESRQPVENPVDQVLREGRIVGLANHTVLIARDGTERPIGDSAAPINNEHGEMLGVVLVFRDVTEQTRAEAADRKNREILKLVHHIGKIGHWEWNSQTDENKWSPEIEALYGLPPGGFSGGYHAWTKLLHPDDLPKAEADVRLALQTGEYFTEFRVIWPDGSVHWLETRANVFKDAHDKPVRIVGVNMDITRRKQQEEALRASELRWRTMADTLPNLVWTDLPDGQCDWLSTPVGRVHRHTRE